MAPEDKMLLALWDYIDDNCNDAEKLRIAHLIATDAAWEKCYTELINTNHFLKNNVELDSPSLRFTKNVMDEVAGMQVAPATRRYINTNIIKGIAAVFVLLIFTLFITAFNQVDWHVAESQPLFNTDKLNSIKAPNWLSDNAIHIIIAANVIIGLLYADYFLRKKQREANH